jgi:HEAT repeat protein
VANPRNGPGFFARAALAAGACILLACAALACNPARVQSEAAPNPDLQGGPMSEAEARQLAQEAAEGLRSPEPELKDAFIAKVVTMLAHRAAAARSAAAEDLGGLARNAASGPLLKALADPDRAVRAAAARALGAAGDAGAAPALVACLKDPSPTVRAASAAALGALASRETARGGGAPTSRDGAGAPPRFAGAPLLVLLDDPEPAVRKEAAVTLGILMGASAVPRLGQTATTDADVPVRAAAAAALGRIGAPDGAASLAKALQDEAPLVRHAAAGAMGAVGDRSVAPPEVAQSCAAALVERLKDRHAAVRAAAAHALGRIGGPAAASALRESARGDPDESVRSAAAEALGKIQAARTKPVE